MGSIRIASVTSVALVLAVYLSLGCGQNPEDPVYDTTANKHGFPPEACRLIEQVEAGQLVTYDLISEAFTDLYLLRGELLENEDWRRIIVALGAKFRFKADELERRGPEFYTQAAGLYALAAFANPGPAETAEKALLFTSWQRLAADFAAVGQVLPTGGYLDQRASLLRLFAQGDSLSGAFADRYLRRRLPDAPLGRGAVDSLSSVNQAYLASIGVCDPPRASIARFLKPGFDLLAWTVVPERQGRRRVEFYFAARDTVVADYWIGLALDSVTIEPQPLSEPDEAEYLSLAPRTPTSRWVRDSVETMTAVVVSEGPIRAASLGLFRLEGGERKWAAPMDSNSAMIPIPVPDSL